LHAANATKQLFLQTTAFPEGKAERVEDGAITEGIAEVLGATDAEIGRDDPENNEVTAAVTEAEPTTALFEAAGLDVPAGIDGRTGFDEAAGIKLLDTDAGEDGA